jgi:hypothetical protein
MYQTGGQGRLGPGGTGTLAYLGRLGGETLVRPRGLSPGIGGGGRDYFQPQQSLISTAVVTVHKWGSHLPRHSGSKIISRVTS